MPLIDIKDVDRKFYQDRISGFLPERIVDIHTHVWRRSDFPGCTSDPRNVSWPARVAADNPIEDLTETYRLMLPGKQVTPLVFAMVPQGGNIDALNGYVQQCACRSGGPALLFTDPSWSAEQTQRRIVEGGFLGAKSYLSLAAPHLKTSEITIFDFFPPHQLEVLNRLGLILMLHLPRDGRLGDPVNLAQMLQIERQYSNLHVVIAHVGRAYCDGDMGRAFEVLAESKSLCFDISANTNQSVFERLIRCVGPRRILFGSDMPILRMRMRRIERQGRYVNLVPAGLYGDVSQDPHMEEVDAAQAATMTFFLYEEIDAFRRAAEATHLGAGDIEDVFYNNGMAMIDAARAGIAEFRLKRGNK